MNVFVTASTMKGTQPKVSHDQAQNTAPTAVHGCCAQWAPAWVELPTKNHQQSPAWLETGVSIQWKTHQKLGLGQLQTGSTARLHGAQQWRQPCRWESRCSTPCLYS